MGFNSGFKGLNPVYIYEYTSYFHKRCINCHVPSKPRSPLWASPPITLPKEHLIRISWFSYVLPISVFLSVTPSLYIKVQKSLYRPGQVLRDQEVKTLRISSQSGHERGKVHINQPTRCNIFSSLLLDVYVQLNMFRASSCPSSGAQ